MKCSAFVICTAIALTAMSPTASPQGPSAPFSIYVGGGFSIPMNPAEFKDSANTGYHGLLGLGFKFGPGIELVGKAEYNQFAYEEFPSVADGGKFKGLMYGVDARFAVGAPVVKFRPYVFAGLGLAKITREDITPSGSNPIAIAPEFFNDQDEVYYNFGGGFEFAGGPIFKLFIQVKYVNVSTEPDAMTFVPITAGVKLF